LFFRLPQSFNRVNAPLVCLWAEGAYIVGRLLVR